MRDGHANGDDRDIRAIAQQLGLPDRQGLRLLDPSSHPGSLLADIAPRQAVILDAGLQHMLQLIFILRCHDDHVRHVAQIGIVECAMMRRAVFRHQPAAIDAEKSLEDFGWRHRERLGHRHAARRSHTSPQPAACPARPGRLQRSRHAARRCRHRRGGQEILFQRHSGRFLRTSLR